MTTYGEYIKTKEAQAKADSGFRISINQLAAHGSKILHFKRGKKGTLDYGKAVVMYSRESPLLQFDPKAKPYYYVEKMDHGLVKAAFNPKTFKLYKSKSAAEKEYKRLAAIL